MKSQDTGVKIVWRAFELRPDPVPTLDPRSEYLTRVWRDAVYPMAERLGMPMRLPPVQPRSRRAHEAAKWVESQGRFVDYNGSLFRAFFETGEDIGDIEVLIRLAADLGLDAASLRLSLESREHEAQVINDERAAKNLGVTGVPAFIADRRAVLFGVQTPAALAELVARVRQVKRQDEASIALRHHPVPINRRGQDEE